MKEHEYYLELINLKIDSMLTPDQEDALSKHMDQCEECGEILGMYSLIHELSPNLLVDPPENFSSGIMYKIGIDKQKALPFKRLLPRLLSIAGAAAAIALILWNNTLFFQASKNTAFDAAPMSESATSAEYDMAQGGELPEAAPPSLFSTDSSPQDRGIQEFGYMASNIFSPFEAEPGDRVAGFVLTDISVSQTDEFVDLVAEFEGTATLSGTLTYENDENGFWGRFLYFTIDDDCFELVPYASNDTRPVWFGFLNQDTVTPLLELYPDDEGKTVNYRATITITDYTFILGASDGCNYTELFEIISLERIY